MAKNIFEESEKTSDSKNIFEDSVPEVQNEDVDKTQEEEHINPSEVELDETQRKTFSTEELNDPNKINVVISDNDCPLVMLFGPPACGKTMTLVRLTRYLNKLGYQISPVRTFRPSYDENYKAMCDGFDEMISSDDAAASTSKIQFMLIQVIKNGKRICQILEAPGELYFDPQKPSASFPNFVNTIINGRGRKIWAIMVEPDWMDLSDRNNYVAKIKRLKPNLRSNDKVAIVFNKIDKTNFIISPGHIHMGAAIKEIGNTYPGIFEPFRNAHPITKFWRKFDCHFVPFQTGHYSIAADGKQTFQEGPEEYPQNFWRVISKLING